jgi:carbon storage regulator CsrA
MLVLTRGLGETIVLSVAGVEVATVAVVRLDGKKARLGIVAPENVDVHRGELMERAGNGNAEGPAD